MHWIFAAIFDSFVDYLFYVGGRGGVEGNKKTWASHRFLSFCFGIVFGISLFKDILHPDFVERNCFLPSNVNCFTIIFPATKIPKIAANISRVSEYVLIVKNKMALHSAMIIVYIL